MDAEMSAVTNKVKHEFLKVLPPTIFFFVMLNRPRFWSVQILLITLIFMYCVIAELARVIGKDRLKVMFVGPLAPIQR
jgi:hypothetical protein